MHAIVYKCYEINDIEKLKPFAVKVVREEDDEKLMAN